MDQNKLHLAVQKYGSTIYKIAMAILKNPHDADDAFQETFLRYYKRGREFESEEHEKAWLIRCVTHVSKGMLRSIFRHSHEPLTENVAMPAKGSFTELLFTLPVKDRLILQLRYVEDYTSDEIAEMMHLSSAAVRKRLERARKRARAIYEKECV